MVQIETTSFNLILYRFSFDFKILHRNEMNIIVVYEIKMFKSNIIYIV